MFNDVLNVRTGNERRKKALAQLKAKMAMTAKAGVAGVANRSGGGLGRQNAARFRPLAKGNMGQLGRMAAGVGRPGFEQAISRFGLTERQPGAYDPGAQEDLGDTGQGGGPQTPIGNDWRNPNVTLSEGPQYWTSPDGGPQQMPGDPGGMQDASGVQQLPGVTSGATSAGGDYSGYVNWQGQWIPMSVYKAMMLTGDL